MTPQALRASSPTGEPSLPERAAFSGAKRGVQRHEQIGSQRDRGEAVF